jgi:hypothetical protein
VKTRLLIAAALVAALAVPTAATAVVPPKNCGTISASGKRFQVKADQISCSTARDHVRRYARTKRAPRGYRCRNLTTRRNKVNFFCYNGRKTFQAIRR